jgi:peptide-methionine (R)-S-oxide reductase
MTQNISDNSQPDFSHLTPEQFAVLREKGTERPYSSPLLENRDEGQYQCAACGAKLFSSETKFDSHCGWPSFYDVENQGSVKLVDDFSHGMFRTEVVCANCDSHLGHVFDDAPDQPTGKRYCINGISLQFKMAV